MAAQGGDPLRRRRISDALAETGSSAARGVSSAPPKEPDSNVLAAVLSLPEKYRLPVHLFYYEGYSIAETAAVLGRRESTVRAQLTRARAMLREKLEVECI